VSPTPRRVSTSTAVLPADGRRQNLSLVLQTLRRLGPTSRAQLAREVGVTKVTMSDLVAELIGEGRVRDVGTAEQAGPGKPATLVDLDRSGLLTLAVDLSVPARLQAAVVDVTGTVLHREERAAAVDAGQGRGLDPAVVVELVRSVLATAQHPVLGIGIGPLLVTLYGFGAARTPTGRSATVMTMLGSGVIVGQSLAAAVTGALAESVSTQVSLLVPLISVVLGLLAGLVNLSLTPPGPLPSATGPVQVQ